MAGALRAAIYPLENCQWQILQAALLYDVLVDGVFSDDVHDAVQCGSISMNVEIDRLGEIQAEDSHNRFCIDYISAGYQIKVTVEFADFVYKCFHFIDGIQ